MRRPMAFAVVLVVVLMAGLYGIVLAGNQYGPGAPCDPNDTTRIIFGENILGDTSDGNDTLILCNNVQRLSDITHTLPGNCNTAVLGQGATWDYCVDSFFARIPSVDILCFYHGTSYTGASEQYHSGFAGSWWDLDHRDWVRSFRWLAHTLTC